MVYDYFGERLKSSLIMENQQLLNNHTSVQHMGKLFLQAIKLKIKTKFNSVYTNILRGTIQ